MSVYRRWHAVAAAVVVATAGAAVALGMYVAGSDDDPATTTASPSPTRSPIPVLVPGRPGESASVVNSDQLPAPDGSRYNQADVWFVRMMIAHHRQALELAALAPGRAGHPQVRAIADRIAVAQRPETEVLRAWLKTRGLAEQMAGHDHAGMAGMHPPEAVEALAGLSGDAFDRRFVEMMAAHHEGAVAMATDVLRAGLDEWLQELATNIAAEQTAEIGRLRQIPL